MMAMLIDLLSWACLVAGGVFCIIGAVGLLRMPDFYTRMHAASVVDAVTITRLGLLFFSGGAATSTTWISAPSRLSSARASSNCRASARRA